MKWTRVACLPLGTYPEAVADASVLAAADFAAALECGLQVTTFGVDFPQICSPLGLANGHSRTEPRRRRKSSAEC